MIKRPKTLVHAVSLALLLALPGISLSQDQPAPSSPSTAVPESTTQKAGSVTPGQEKQEPASAPKPGPTAASVEATAAAPQEPLFHMIKQGDTLWDISQTYLKDPFLWPFIWKANPNITNPDLIYPGNKLAIPSMAPIERAMEAPAKEQVVEKQVEIRKEAPPEKAAVEEHAPPEPKPTEGIAAARATKPTPVQPAAEEAPRRTLILPEEQTFPIIDKYAMLSAGFVNQEEAADRIIGAREEVRSQFSYDQVVYVKVGDPEKVKVGDKFLIYSMLDKVKHPVTGEYMGHLIRGLGILQITDKSSPDALTARITLSFDTITRNSLVTPYQEPVEVFNQKAKKAKDISGYIIEVTDERRVNSQLEFVYLDKGSAEGVEAGDTFIVYAEHEDSSLPKENIAEIQVFLVKEHTATALVRKNTVEVSKGNQIVYKK